MMWLWWGNQVPVGPLEGLESEVSQEDRGSCLSKQPQQNTRHHGLNELPSWQYTPGCCKKYMLSAGLRWERTDGGPCLVFSGPYPMRLFPVLIWTGLHLVYYTVILSMMALLSSECLKWLWNPRVVLGNSWTYKDQVIFIPECMVGLVSRKQIM